MNGPSTMDVEVRTTRPDDFPGIIELSQRVYPESLPWSERALRSHLDVFAQGQLVAVEPDTQHVVGMAASLIVRWDDYDIDTSWREITAGGMFTNHDPEGRTLYGAEIMVRPDLQGHGIGKKIYKARRELARTLRMRRIRAGARLRGYHRHAAEMDAETYVMKVVRGELTDPTLTFQLRQHFRVVAVIKGYLRFDPASLGYAAVIEWINHDVAKKRDYEGRPGRFEISKLEQRNR